MCCVLLLVLSSHCSPIVLYTREYRRGPQLLWDCLPDVGKWHALGLLIPTPFGGEEKAAAVGVVMKIFLHSLLLLNQIQAMTSVLSSKCPHLYVWEFFDEQVTSVLRTLTFFLKLSSDYVFTRRNQKCKKQSWKGGRGKKTSTGHAQ